MQLSEKDKIQICRDFARNLIKIRKHMNLTQKEFGHLVGASKERINAIENERSVMRWPLYCSILFYCFANLESKQFVLHNQMIDPRTFRFLQSRVENEVPLLNIITEAAGYYQEQLYRIDNLEK